MTWVCDNCYSEMNVSKENYNRYRVECPNCGTYWFIDKDDEMINDGTAWSPNDDDDDECRPCPDCNACLYWDGEVWACSNCDYTEDDE